MRVLIYVILFWLDLSFYFHCLTAVSVIDLECG